MSKHARLSPSAAHRWINCPASVVLSEKVEDKGSKYAAEGTFAHKLAALLIEKELLGVDNEYETVASDPRCDQDMIDYTYDYLSYVTSIVHEHKSPIIKLETRLDISAVSKDTFGTADCLIVSGNRVDVIDFKYGKNVEVSALENDQLRLYGLGALEFFDSLIYDIKTIGLHIVQPRMNNYESEVIPKETLIEWAKPVREKARIALHESPEPVRGEWCMFCRAKPFCKAYSKKFDSSIEPADPRVLSYKEIADLIKALDGLEGYQKELKTFALEQALEGAIIPGFKVVEGRSNRTWKNQEEAFKTLISDGVEEDKLYQKKPLTAPQTEKLLGKKRFKEYESLVEKPPGKLTLVEETDKREAYIRNGKDQFNKIDLSEIKFD